MNRTGKMYNSMLSMEEFAVTVKEVLRQQYRDCQVMLQEVQKNNGQTRIGIVIRNEKSNVAPLIYLDDYFKQYQSGRSLTHIFKDVAETYERNRVTYQINANKMSSFDMVKEHICFKLVNAEKNVALLRTIPHRLYQDLAVVYYVLVEKNENGTASITVENRIMEFWGVDEQVLFALAKRNTPRLLGEQVLSMAEMFLEDMGEMTDETKDLVNIGEKMYVATNLCGLNGASIMLYDGVLERFGKRIGRDYYILPWSINELGFVPAVEGIDKEFLIRMVQDINRTGVALEEVLSDHVYYYHGETKCVKMIA